MKTRLIVAMILLAGAVAWVDAGDQKEPSPARIVFYVQ
jgi:hypothetical protein